MIHSSAKESQEERKNYKHNYQELPNIIQEYGIFDQDKFLEFAKSFDVDHDYYFNKEELIDAAKQYLKQGLNTP